MKVGDYVFCFDFYTCCIFYMYTSEKSKLEKKTHYSCNIVAELGQKAQEVEMCPDIIFTPAHRCKSALLKRYALT